MLGVTRRHKYTLDKKMRSSQALALDDFFYRRRLVKNIIFNPPRDSNQVGWRAGLTLKPPCYCPVL
jgi:hypothetical protein